MILYTYNIYGPQMIPIDLGVIRLKVKVTRAHSFSTISDSNWKGFRPGLMILYIYNVYGRQIISIDLES